MVAHFPAAAPHPPQNTFSPCPDPLGKDFFRKLNFPPAQPPRQNHKGNKSRGSEEKESVAEISEKKKRVKIVTFHVYGANVTIVGAANRSQLLPSHDPHAPLSSALAAASPPCFTQNSALGAGTQLPGPSSTPSPRHHPTHPPKPSRERVFRHVGI